MALIAQVVEVKYPDGRLVSKTVVATVASASNATEVANAVAAALPKDVSFKQVGSPLTITTS